MPIAKATSRAARSTPVWPPLMILSIRGEWSLGAGFSMPLAALSDT
jgi:hypothetical protein